MEKEIKRRIQSIYSILDELCEINKDDKIYLEQCEEFRLDLEGLEVPVCEEEKNERFNP